MTSPTTQRRLADLAAGLKLNYPKLGILLTALCKQPSAHDFFQLLATQLLPHLRRHPSFTRLIDRWGRQYRNYRRRHETLKANAIEDVRAAIELLSEQLAKSPEFNTSEVSNCLDKAKGYLNGSIPTYMPPSYQQAADSLASACRLILGVGGQQLLSDIAKLTTIKKSRQIEGRWVPIDYLSIESCNFFKSINKIATNQSAWGWDRFDEPFVCWGYLRLVERCWKLAADDFEGEPLKHGTTQESQRSAEFLGLHQYWTELHSIKAQHQNLHTPFFTRERFCRYLELIATEILTQTPKNQLSDDAGSLGIRSIELSIDGEYLLLIVDSGPKKDPTRYLLHTFNGMSNPRTFINKLLSRPGEEVAPSDIGMKSGKCAQLLERAKLTGPLKDLFVQKGSCKGSITVPKVRVIITNQELATRLKVQHQLDEMSLPFYKG